MESDMYQFTPRLTLLHVLHTNRPAAMAWVTGNAQEPQISGLIKFYDTPYDGVLIEAEVFGLPDQSMANPTAFYAMHIHENGDCSDQFAHTGDHYNPSGQLHPNHAGDLVPLLSNHGYAWCSFYDSRFTVDEILGRSVILHAMPDDFRTQPSGNSGEKIACGVIRKE